MTGSITVIEESRMLDWFKCRFGRAIAEFGEKNEICTIASFNTEVVLLRVLHLKTDIDSNTILSSDLEMELNIMTGFSTANQQSMIFESDIIIDLSICNDFNMKIRLRITAIKDNLSLHHVHDPLGTASLHRVSSVALTRCFKPIS